MCVISFITIQTGNTARFFDIFEALLLLLFVLSFDQKSSSNRQKHTQSNGSPDPNYGIILLLDPILDYHSIKNTRKVANSVLEFRRLHIL
jgi:hypothetical protein